MTYYTVCDLRQISENLATFGFAHSLGVPKLSKLVVDNCQKFKTAIFLLLVGRRKKMKDFLCFSDILACSPNDRFLTDQLYHLLLKPSNISLRNGFILSHTSEILCSTPGIPRVFKSA